MLHRDAIRRDGSGWDGSPQGSRYKAPYGAVQTGQVKTLILKRFASPSKKDFLQSL